MSMVYRGNVKIDGSITNYGSCKISKIFIIFCRLDWDLWVMMGLIGFVVGFIGFLLHQTIEWLTDIRINKASEYLAVSVYNVYF